jgi:hypothetical protein
MTNGFVLIFVGIQLNLVHSYELTPRVSKFLSHRSNNESVVVNNSSQSLNSPYYQASFPTVTNRPTNGPSQPMVIVTPPWLCWPVLFLGTVVFLHGFSKRRE